MRNQEEKCSSSDSLTPLSLDEEYIAIGNNMPLSCSVQLAEAMVEPWSFEIVWFLLHTDTEPCRT